MPFAARLYGNEDSLIRCIISKQKSYRYRHTCTTITQHKYCVIGIRSILHQHIHHSPIMHPKWQRNNTWTHNSQRTHSHNPDLSPFFIARIPWAWKILYPNSPTRAPFASSVSPICSVNSTMKIDCLTKGKECP